MWLGVSLEKLLYNVAKQWATITWEARAAARPYLFG